MKNAWIIFKKEIKNILKNKSIWLPVLIITFVFSLAFPLVLTLGGTYIFSDPDTLEFINRIFPATEDPFRSFLSFAIKQLVVLLLLIPAMLPSLIAPASVVMEKNSNTLEPLLATPIKTSEILFGKTLTSLIPSYALSLISFTLMVITIDSVSLVKYGFAPLPTVEWVIAAFILSPILSFIITMLSIMVSSRSKDIRSAQGIGAVVIFPIYAIIGLQFAGFFLLNVIYLLIACLVLLAICPLLLRLAIKIFDREHILTKWKLN